MLTPATRICARLLSLFIVSAALTTTIHAGPGHDHGHGAETIPKKPANPRVEMTSEAYELVAILKEHDLVVYLDRLVDTAPVTEATIDLSVNGTTGSAKLQPDGSYVFQSPALEPPGVFEIVAIISGPGADDLLVGTLDATSVNSDTGSQDNFGHDHAIHHAEDANHTGVQSVFHTVHTRMASQPFVVLGIGIALGLFFSVLLRSKPSTLVMLLSAGFVFGLPDFAAATPGHDHSHEHANPAEHPATHDAPGRTADGHIFIPKPTQRLLEIRTKILKPHTVKRTQRLIGRVIADPNRNGLVQSTMRGRIKPPKTGLPVLGQTVSAGDVLALVEPAFAPIDASDVRQTAGDLEQRMAVLEAQLARRTQLVTKNIASKASLQDLEIELEGLKTRRRQLDESRSKPESLRAPVSGVVADVRVVAGQVVASADTLYQIVDPNYFWVEAITFDPKIAIAAAAKAMTADHLALDLSFVGRSRTLQQQATVLQYKIGSPTKSLSIGEPVTVNVETGEPVTGIIVPKDAVAEAPNGQRVAFVRQSAEQYRAVPVRVENLDGARFHVVAGLKAGDQIIVRNAALVSQIK